MSFRSLALVFTLSFAAAGCQTPEEEAPAAADEDSPQQLASAEQTAFWATLQAMCGQAFGGELIEIAPPSTDFDGQALVMHVRSCSEDEIRIPFFVGEDRSRTWVFTPTPTGIRLKHDHRHEDGTEDEVTQYGGDTDATGTASSQSFPADAFTAELLPEAATNVWTVEVVPGESFAYQLIREGTDRFFRVEFDLSVEIATPPAPWGSEGG